MINDWDNPLDQLVACTDVSWASLQKYNDRSHRTADMMFGDAPGHTVSDSQK